MTIEQRADDSATQHSLKRFVLLAWLPFRDNFLAVRKTPNVQTLWVRWATAKAGEIRRVRFLDTVHDL
jgi:hypothetical protein